MFGDYDKEKDRAIIQELFLQGENGKAPEVFVRAETRVLWSVSIDYQGAPHKLAVLVSRPLGPQDLPENCNDCKPIIGAALLGQGADGWKAEVLTPYITRAANAEDAGKPVLLEPVDGSAWMLQLESGASEASRETIVTTLIALLPPGLNQAAAFISPLALPTRVDERGATACSGQSGCQVYDVKLTYNRLAGEPLYDLVATTQGYLKTVNGNRIPLDKVDYYTFKDNQYQPDIFKSADLTERYRQRQCNPCQSLGRLNWPYFE